MSTSLFAVSMNMESPCPTSMKWIVTFAPVWAVAGVVQVTARRSVTVMIMVAVLFIGLSASSPV